MPNETSKLAKRTIGMALIIFFSLLFIFHVIICSGMSSYESGESSHDVGLGTIYTGAATIAGLATFGSILGLKFSKTYEKPELVEINVITVFSSITILIFIQGVLMFITYYGVLTQYIFAVILALSITLLIMPVLGLSRILEQSFKDGSANTKDD